MKNGKEYEWVINVVSKYSAKIAARSENAFIVRSKSFLGAIQKATKLINELGTTQRGDSHWYIRSAWFLDPPNDDDESLRAQAPDRPKLPQT